MEKILFFIGKVISWYIRRKMGAVSEKQLESKFKEYTKILEDGMLSDNK